ncbi:M48 family metalloprotease [Hamadaea tsunoensis]|uniref:M48 family metalloprotease n=1 Tax=Hamadaea tsunoensis TaxID=53368 RepID=UPI0004045365|nr:M48 family metalloprotease [Hamadaea tsunoensis]
MRLLYLPVLVAAVIPVLARWLVRRVPPRPALWWITGCCVVVAATTLWSAVVLAGSLAEDLGAERPGDAEPVLDAEAIAGLVALTAAVALSAWSLTVSALRRRRVARELSGRAGTLVVFPLPDAYAFCVPGRPGRIVVTQGMLQALSARQRRVLLAHERAHLRFGHHAFRLATTVAAAVNPLLRPVRPIVAYLCERCADEYASTAVGDRRLSASSLAAAALAASATPAGLPGFHDLGVVDRVRALLAPLPATRPLLLTAAAVGGTAALVAADARATAALIGFLTGCGC